jgi:hypothetical protein
MLSISSCVFFANCTSFFEEAVFSSFVHFFIGLFIFGEFSFLSSLYILIINHLSDIQLAKIFSHSMGSLFNLETISFAVQKFLNFMCSHLSIHSLSC